MTTEKFIASRIIELYYVQAWSIAKIAEAVARSEDYVQEVLDNYEHENTLANERHEDA